MEQTSLLPLPKKKKLALATKPTKILKIITEAIQSKKGENIISLDLRKIKEASTDFMLICEANSSPQVRAISENVKAEVLKKCGEAPRHFEGQQGLSWVLIDYVNVVVHIMLPETRKFYSIEEMWSDAAKEELNG